MNDVTIGVDVGGTKVLGGVVDADGNVLATTKRPSPAGDVAAIRRQIVDIVAELRGGYQVAAVGVGAAGWIDEKRSTVLFAPNLAWRDEPLREALMSQLDLPVVVENDANVAAWAEFRFGAGRHAKSMALFTVGTGIGGGVVIHDQLVRGAHGIASEFGHVLAVPDGMTCGCGRHGCLEQYASGSALVRFARETVAANPSDGERLLALAAGDADAVTGEMVTEAAAQGDRIAVAAFESVGGYLGEAMADMVQLIDPDVIVIGGGVITAGELLLKPARLRYHAVLHARGRSPVAEIVAAGMGANAGIIGAADLARH